jgi:biotin carboxyl carrier protein
MKRLFAFAILALSAAACATTQPERISFEQAFASAKAPRAPKKKKVEVGPEGAVPSPELQGALVRFGNLVRAGRNGAPRGAAMPAPQVEAWGAALEGVEVFLATSTAQMSPYDLVRARVVLEAELEADAALWGDFPKEVAARAQELISGVREKLLTVNALRNPPRPVNWKRFAWPLAPVVITSPYGERVHPMFGDHRLHKGVDLLADPAQAVHAPYTGTVVFSGWQGAYGKRVELQHDIEVTTTYSHLMTLMVKEGDVVRKGQLIGLAGETGNATGVHLHFELYKRGLPVDPELLLPSVYDFFRVAEAW